MWWVLLLLILIQQLGLCLGSGCDTIQCNALFQVDICTMTPTHGTNDGGSYVDFSGSFKPAPSRTIEVFFESDGIVAPCNVALPYSDAALRCSIPSLFDTASIIFRIQDNDHITHCIANQTLSFVFDYDAPILDSADPASIPFGKTTTVQVLGSNFGTRQDLIHVEIQNTTDPFGFTTVAGAASAPEKTNSEFGFYTSITPPFQLDTEMRICVGVGNLANKFKGKCSNTIPFKYNPGDVDFDWMDFVLIPALIVLFLMIIGTFIILRWRRHRTHGKSDLSMRLLDSMGDHWNIESDDVEFEECIGTGGFAVVYKGKWRGVTVAVKLIKAARISNTDLKAFADECKLLSRLHHPNIVQLFGASNKMSNATNTSITARSDLIIVTEFMEKGSLQEVLQKETLEWNPIRLRMLIDATKGMLYLHSGSNFVLHRDLKTANLLVDKTYTVKIADFGLSRVATEDETMTACGTPKYAAPEVLNHSRYYKPADVWSFGVILWEVYTLQPPYNEIPPMQVAIKVASRGHFLPMTDDMDPAVRDLIESCLQSDPQQRPTFDQILHSLEEMMDS